MDFKTCWDCRYYATPIGEDGIYNWCEKENRVIPVEEITREHSCSEEEYFHCGHA